MTDDDYDALSQKHLASIKRDMRVSLEDAAVRATHKVMAEYETSAQRMKEELAQPAQEPWCMKMNGCKTKCADCPDEPAQEPVLWLTKNKFSGEVDFDAKNAKETTGWSAAFPVYTTPQQRPWVGLTEQELESAYWGYMEIATQNGFEKTVKAIEAKLKEKNT
jgi:hypothetical protein